jgi:membrane associated rhomboid family serine protease
MRLGFPKPTGVVLATMVTLVAIWIVSAILVRFTAFGADLYRALVLVPALVFEEGRVWTLVTYALVHDLTTPFSVLLTCIFFFFFGSELEGRWGKGRLLLFYFLTALGGGALALLAWVFGLSQAGALGAQSVGLALMVAWALTFPYREILLFFVLPLKGIQMVWLAVGFGVLRAISLSPSGVAADFGAMGMAALLVLGIFKTNRLKLSWDKLLVFLRLRKPARLYVVPKGPSKYHVN